jgi:hypothetical protein
VFLDQTQEANDVVKKIFFVFFTCSIQFFVLVSCCGVFLHLFACSLRRRARSSAAATAVERDGPAGPGPALPKLLTTDTGDGA